MKCYFPIYLLQKPLSWKQLQFFCREKRIKSRAAAKAIKAYAFFPLSVKYGKDSGCRMLLSEQRQLAQQLANSCPTTGKEVSLTVFIDSVLQGNWWLCSSLSSVSLWPQDCSPPGSVFKGFPGKNAHWEAFSLLPPVRDLPATQGGSTWTPRLLRRRYSFTCWAIREAILLVVFSI